ncbi:MAG TPA: signal peptidase II [bacterium]|nr:signal peptidase II [bacterium]HOM26268.1 signal peptidase II [bacterium]
MKFRFFLKIFLTTSFLALFFDQITKSFIVRLLKKTDGNINITSFLSFTLIKNQGIVFGLFNNEKTRIFIIIFSFIAIFFIIFAILKLKKTEKYHQFSLGLIVGGTIGNLLDRIRFGYVIDFINFHFWPVFNFADAFISIGVILFFIKYLKE